MNRPCALFRLVLLAAWLLVIVAAFVLGERTASWSSVKGLVASGEVDRVRVSGELPESATGYGLVTVHWRRGLFGYQAQVLQVRGRQVDEARSSNQDVTTVVRTPPSGLLKALRPGLLVFNDNVPVSDATVFGWRVPGVVGVLAVLLALLGLGLLVAGPVPWRATRWAWFWLLVPPVGSIAFLLLSGPTPGVPAPRDPDRRLRGGWAFVLSLPLAGLLGSSRW